MNSITISGNNHCQNPGAIQILIKERGIVDTIAPTDTANTIWLISMKKRMSYLLLLRTIDAFVSEVIVQPFRFCVFRVCSGKDTLIKIPSFYGINV